MGKCFEKKYLYISKKNNSFAILKKRIHQKVKKNENYASIYFCIKCNIFERLCCTTYI